jgi:hypothetical protein
VSAHALGSHPSAHGLFENDGMTPTTIAESNSRHRRFAH